MTKKCSPVCRYSLFETNFGKQAALHLEYRQRKPALQMHKTWTHSQDKATPEKIQMALFHLPRTWSWCSHTEQHHHHHHNNNHHHRDGHPHHRLLIRTFICSCKLVSSSQKIIGKNKSGGWWMWSAEDVDRLMMPRWCIFFIFFFLLNFVLIELSFTFSSQP